MKQLVVESLKVTVKPYGQNVRAKGGNGGGSRGGSGGGWGQPGSNCKK